VSLTVDAIGGRTLTGKVRKIGLLGTATTGVVSVPVTVDIDPTDAAIYPGLSATVDFQVGL
jgi:HlyD family secretion protein